MLGMKSTNEPMKGKFAEQFCEQLLRSESKPAPTAYNIVVE